MPIIRITISPQDIERKRRLAEAFTEIAAEITQIPKEAFVVIVDEHPRENIAVGGTLLCDRQ